MVEEVPSYISHRTSSIEDKDSGEKLRWCSVSLSEIISTGKRLEASVFDPEGKRARQLVENGKYPYQHITGEDGLASAYTCNRFKRIWVAKSDCPIYQPTSILDIKPDPDGYISRKTETDIDKLRVHKNQVLLTCSGTIGNVSLVSETLDNQIFSHDLLRITCNNEVDAGYLYAYLKSEIGKRIVVTNKYGSVISHIEAQHLDSIPIPKVPDVLKEKISRLVLESFTLRDESNKLLDAATHLLYDALSLYDFDTSLGDDKEIGVFSVKLSDLNLRLDASFHNPIYGKLVSHLQNHAKSIVLIGDERVSQSIYLPNRFKRVYVKEGHGLLFFSGKDMLQLAPVEPKYLSTKPYSSVLLSELILRKNMIVISRSGTIGNITLVPEHWDGWAMSDDIIRLVPNEDLAGYIYIWLRSKYGKLLLEASSYGAVVTHIEVEHVASVYLPLISDTRLMSQVNDMAIRANNMRTEAYVLERRALNILQSEVFDA